MNGQTEVALLTAGRDPHYAFGLTKALVSQQVRVDLIGGDGLDFPAWHTTPLVNFLNLKGDGREEAPLLKKILRIVVYYFRLIRYAALARPKIIHILWNNKFETFDRAVLMLYYKLLAKKTVLTVHNVNKGERDSCDSWFNRVTLKIQYRLVDHLFVHTERMRRELIAQFDVPTANISVIPYGINNAVPHTDLTPDEARQRLGISKKDRTILFFGHIAPYKGLEFLIEAFRQIMTKAGDYRLIVAGNPKNCEEYWNAVQESLGRLENHDRILQHIAFIPDAETEIYFKAADVVVLPYRHIFQSGVLSLSYSFGVPVIASDVGALREDIIEGKTGFVCRPEDPTELARAIEKYFATNLYFGLSSHRQEIREYAYRRFSWDVVSELTKNVYEDLLAKHWAGKGREFDPR